MARGKWISSSPVLHSRSAVMNPLRGVSYSRGGSSNVGGSTMKLLLRSFTAFAAVLFATAASAGVVSLKPAPAMPANLVHKAQIGIYLSFGPRYRYSSRRYRRCYRRTYWRWGRRHWRWVCRRSWRPAHYYAPYYYGRPRYYGSRRYRVRRYRAPRYYGGFRSVRRGRGFRRSGGFRRSRIIRGGGFRSRRAVRRGGFSRARAFRGRGSGGRRGGRGRRR
ncbi:MAG: hypothetical protein RLZ98_2406 [Pseudomonadota bacterium]